MLEVIEGQLLRSKVNSHSAFHRALRLAAPQCPKPSLALTPAVLVLCPRTQMVEGEFQASGLARYLVNRGETTTNRYAANFGELRAYELRRIPLPRTPVNKGIRKEDRG
jgi:hypothetical protein